MVPLVDIAVAWPDWFLLLYFKLCQHCFCTSFRSRGVVARWSPGSRASVRSSLTYVMSFPDLPTLTTSWTLSARSDATQTPWPLRPTRYKAFYPVWRTSRRNWRVTHQNVPACCGEKALRPTSWLFGERRKLWADRLERCGERKVLTPLVPFDSCVRTVIPSPAEWTRPGKAGPGWGCCWEGARVLQACGWTGRPAGKCGRRPHLTEHCRNRGGNDQTAAEGL